MSTGEDIQGAITGCAVVIEQLAMDFDLSDRNEHRFHVSSLFLVEAQLERMTELMGGIVKELMARKGGAA